MRKALPDITGTGSLISDYDVYLFRQGNHFRLYERLGSHPATLNDIPGTFFAVWAPNAAEVSVIGDFNGWEATVNPLRIRNDDSGIWEGFIPEIGHGTLYKYHIKSRAQQLFRGERRSLRTLLGGPAKDGVDHLGSCILLARSGVDAGPRRG
ncbi:MAG: hypothetical protein RQM90_02555 [Methanoculleus sp.]